MAHHVYLSALVAVAIAFSACYEPRSGCLDIAATNFDATADQQCPDKCCAYPQLILKFEHRLNDGFFSENTLQTDENGQNYRLKNFSILVSEVALIDETGTAYRVTDSVGLRLEADSLRLPDDFFILSDGTISYSLGEFSAAKTFVKIRIKVGLPTTIASAVPALWPEDHPLANNILFDADAYRLGVFAFQPDTLLPDSIRSQFFGLAAEPLVFEYNFTTPLLADPGFDRVITIPLYHEKWLENIPLQNLSAEDLEAVLLNSLPKVFGQ